MNPLQLPQNFERADVITSFDEMHNYFINVPLLNSTVFVAFGNNPMGIEPPIIMRKGHLGLDEYGRINVFGAVSLLLTLEEINSYKYVIIWHHALGTGIARKIEKGDRLFMFGEMSPLHKQMYSLSEHELASAYTRVQQAEDLIMQLPENHEGRNTWLLQYGESDYATRLRAERNLGWDFFTKSVTEL